MSAPQVEKLESDVTREEAEGLITFVQTVSTSFRGYSEEDISLLAGHFSVMRFEPGQVVMQKGEQGTWFGVLLEGSLAVEIPGVTIVVPAGAIVGEMAMWQRGATRSATLKGHEKGLIATMLVDDLPQLYAASPATCAKLMRQMGQTALSKQVENVRRARSQAMKPTIPWRSDAPTKRERELAKRGQPPAANKADRAAEQQQAACDSLFTELLCDKGFEADEAALLVDLAQYHHFRGEEQLLMEGQAWPYVMFVVQGAVNLERYNLEVCDGGQVGAVEYYGCNLFTDTSALRGSSSVLAGILRVSAADRHARRGRAFRRRCTQAAPSSAAMDVVRRAAIRQFFSPPALAPAWRRRQRRPRRAPRATGGWGACRARRHRPPGSSTPHSSRRRTGARRSATPRRGRLPY